MASLARDWPTDFGSRRPRRPKIAVDVCPMAISVFVGRSSIKVTYDLYEHLMPGAESGAAALPDAFLGGSRNG